MRVTSFFILLMIAAFGCNQSSERTTSEPSADGEMADKLFNVHDRFKADFISHRRFKHAGVMSFLDGVGAPLSIKQVGKSIDGKAIKLVSLGNGEETVLLWSQMHGNEPTATMALMDIFNFFQESGDELDEFRNAILSNLNVHFIPMLNPDGADRFTRRNSQGIDINRDALRQQTPEGRTLKKVRDSLDAAWGFNLHDQGRSSYVTDKSATISLLAPAYNFEKTINEKRGNAMQLIALMNESLQQFIPDQVSLYNDDFEPRAFGDNIQLWGSRTILVESGGLLDDRDKQVIRKLNFMAILMSLYGIATNDYNRFTTDDYFNIPGTNRGFRDLIVKNVQLPASLGDYKTDLAYNFWEVENDASDDYYLETDLVDLGDLSTSGAYKIYDMSGYEVGEGKTYDRILSDVNELQSLDLKELIGQGYSDFIVREAPNWFEVQLPVRIWVGEKDNGSNGTLTLRDNPSLLFYEGGTVKHALINGYVFSLDQDWEEIVSGIAKL